jgi:hypothetical protein
MATEGITGIIKNKKPRCCFLTVVLNSPCNKAKDGIL